MKKNRSQNIHYELLQGTLLMVYLAGPFVTGFSLSFLLNKKWDLWEIEYPCIDSCFLSRPLPWMCRAIMYLLPCVNTSIHMQLQYISC